MKFCNVCRNYITLQNGGMERAAHNLNVGLAKTGHEVHMITSGHPDGIDCEMYEGVNVWYTQSKPRVYSSEFTQDQIRIFNNLKPDIVHSESRGANGIFSESINIPKLVRFHGLAIDHIRTAHLMGKRDDSQLDVYQDEKSIIEQSDVCIALNDYVYNTLRTDYFADKISIIPYGIDIDAFPKKRQTNDKFNVLSVGRLAHDKGFQDIINHMPDLINAIPNFHYTIVGMGNVNTYMNMAKEIGVVDRLSIITDVPHSEMYKYYQKADLFVNPSYRFAGQDNTTLEAYSCGCPCMVRIDNYTMFVFVMQENWTDSIVKFWKQYNTYPYINPINRKEVSIKRMIGDYNKLLREVK